MNFILSNYIETEKGKLTSELTYLNKYLSAVYIQQSKIFPKITKFVYLQSVLSNPFYTETNKSDFLDLFCKMQNHYFAFNRMMFIRKFKRANIIISNDLLLNPINETDHTKTLAIIFNKNKYLFSLTDLINISMSALTNSPNYFTNPLPIKNPYTNIKFNETTLYNIYFFIKRNYCIMPQLIHNYFLVNFKLKQYLYENESIIRNYVINKVLNTSTNKQLKRDILVMLKPRVYINSQFQIDEEFPTELLVKVFRPYLKLHYINSFSDNGDYRDESAYKLSQLLLQFYKVNPHFGRKLINVSVKTQYDFVKKQNVKIKTKTVSFNTKHIPYHILVKGVRKFVEPAVSHYVSVSEDVSDTEDGEVTDNESDDYSIIDSEEVYSE